MHRDSLRFSQRAGFHEGERESIYQCMPAVLILTLSFFLVVFFLSFPLVSFSISQFLFSSAYFLVKVLIVPLFFCSRQDPFFIVPTVTGFYCLSP